MLSTITIFHTKVIIWITFFAKHLFCCIDKHERHKEIYKEGDVERYKL